MMVIPFEIHVFYKHHLYKHRDPQNWSKIKRHLSTTPSITIQPFIVVCNTVKT